MPVRLIPLLLACALVGGGWPHSARADVRRCVTANGQTIFTDRKCDEINAAERLPRSSVSPGTRVHRAGGCARTVQDLVFEVTSAIDARDANRLAGVYHWPGTSAQEGYRIWTQLDAVANRQLVDIVPVMPAISPPPVAPVASDIAPSPDDTAAAPLPKPDDPELYPQNSVNRNPVALRVEQTLANAATPSRTVFGLTHYFGCWWLRF
jgi:hypothetical protein